MTRSAKGTVGAPGRNVAAKAGLNRSILDVAWGDLREKLAYKAVRDGAKLILVDPRQTSQCCSGCSELVPKTLAVRTHHCPACGLILDRDENAANNILALALSAARTTSAATAADAGRPVRAAYNGAITDTISQVPPGVPEPASLALLGTALVGFGFAARRRRQQG